MQHVLLGGGAVAVAQGRVVGGEAELLDVHLVGAGNLSATYGEALRIAGGEVVIEMGEALTLAGLRSAHAAMMQEVA